MPDFLAHSVFGEMLMAVPQVQPAIPGERELAPWRWGLQGPDPFFFRTSTSPVRFWPKSTNRLPLGSVKILFGARRSVIRTGSLPWGTNRPRSNCAVNTVPSFRSPLAVSKVSPM